MHDHNILNGVWFHETIVSYSENIGVKYYISYSTVYILISGEILLTSETWA